MGMSTQASAPMALKSGGEENVTEDVGRTTEDAEESTSTRPEDLGGTKARMEGSAGPTNGPRRIAERETMTTGAGRVNDMAVGGNQTIMGSAPVEPDVNEAQRMKTMGLILLVPILLSAMPFFEFLH